MLGNSYVLASLSGHSSPVNSLTILGVMVRDSGPCPQVPAAATLETNAGAHWPDCSLRGLGFLNGCSEPGWHMQPTARTVSHLWAGWRDGWEGIGGLILLPYSWIDSAQTQ